MNSLPSNWTEAAVEEINCHESRNVTPSEFPEENFELYSVPAFPTDQPEHALGKDIGSSKQLVEPDDVLLCKINPRINRVWLVGEKRKFRQIASSEWIVVRSQVMFPQYLRYAFSRKKFRDLLCSEVAGVGGSLTRAQPKKVARYTVPIAPLSEQIRIANKLDSIFAKVDAAQARLENIPALLKRFRQAVLSAATSGELTREWRSNFSTRYDNQFSADAIDEYDGQLLNELPDTWCYLPFSGAADIRSNLVDPQLSPQAIHLAPNHIESNTGRILELATVQQDAVISGKHRFFPGQLVYSKIRPYLNKVCYVDFPGLCSADMYPITPRIEPKYLLYYMLSGKFVSWTAQQQGRVVLPKINQKALSKIPVPTPSLPEQKEIARRVESLFALADAVEKQYLDAKKRTDRLTQSLLAKAFRGELVPQDPNDEPAEELLKRIKAERGQPPASKPTRKAATRKQLTTKKIKAKIMKLADAPASYLFDLLNDLGGEAHAEVLWKKSELGIDDFYAKLKQEVRAKRILDNGSRDPNQRKLAIKKG